LEVFGEILAGPKIETYMMNMINGDAMMNPRQKVRTLNFTQLTLLNLA